jgi:hypothetical protein
LIIIDKEKTFDALQDIDDALWEKCKQMNCLNCSKENLCSFVNGMMDKLGKT